MNNRVWDWLKNRFSASTPSVEQNPCFWQIDMHSHLIPGIDDGVKTMEQSISCIRQLSEWGIKKIITTPHISYRFFPNDPSELLAGRDTLQQQVDLEQIPVQIEVAAEYMLDEFFLERLNTTPLLTFGSERYLLIETGLIARPMLLDEMLFHIQTSGYTPILAHPERYHYYYNDIASLEKLRDLGCLFQVNWMSFTGRYGSQPRTQAKLLLKNKWADFIGSDLHRPEDIPALNALFKSSSYNLLIQQPFRNKSL